MLSSIKIDDIIEYSVKNNQKFACLVDINTMFGTIEFYKKCIKNNLKPVIGVQINDVAYIARNNTGLKQLYTISSAKSKNIDFSSFNLSECYAIIIKDNKSDIKCYKKIHINNIAAKENFCMDEKDIKILKSIEAIRENKLFDEINTDFTGKCIANDELASTMFNNEQINNLEQLLQDVNIKIDLSGKNEFVKFDITTNSTLRLKDLCNIGLQTKTNSSEVYVQRMENELKVINEMGFEDYFLVVYDYINFAKSSNIYVGPGRGSVGGSLVAYLLGITEIDPIKHNLIFERFLNIARQNMPDIDVDIEDERRNEVVEYLFKKYGEKNISTIITFQRMKAKMALTDVGRILKIDNKIVKNITKLYGIQHEDDVLGPTKANEEIKSYYSQYPELFEIADSLIGIPRQSGQHAAGIILCNQPICNIAPTIYINNHQVVQYEMGYLEELGLIKMDLLGLSTLTLIKNIIKLIWENKKYEVKLKDINIDDINVFKQLSSGDTIGIFQLESSGMTSLARRIKPRDIEDISLLLALYRPGPMKNIDTFIENRNNPSKIVYFNKLFEKYLSSTSNVIVYQEQMIEIIKGVCNYSLAKADIFRWIMSKKKQNELQALKYDFLLDSQNNGYSKEESEKIFLYIESFADYGFNHSHSLSYSYLSYWMCYLKFYYPSEFITILLESNNGSNEKINAYVNEAKSLNLTVLPPSLLNSKKSFCLLRNKIIFGFNSIKGFGDSISEKIIKLRDKYGFKNYQQVISLFVKNGIGESSVKTLIEAGAFDDFLQSETRTYLIKNIANIYAASKYLTEDGTFIIQPNLIDVVETDEEKKSLNIQQFNLLGVDFSKNEDEEKFKSLRQLNNTLPISDVTINKVGKNNVIGEIISIKELTTKYGAVMAFVNIKDDTKQIKITYWPATFSKIKGLLTVGKIYKFEIDINDKGIIGSSIIEEINKIL